MAVREATIKAEEVPEVLLRKEFRIISDLIADSSHVLDLGCSEGDLLAWLAEHKNVQARGVEIAQEKVRRCVQRGLSVFQGDINQGLQDFPDHCFDYVILSQTMQAVRQPLTVLREMRRVGHRFIVTFPNFGHWSVRLSLLFGGRAPKTGHLPYEWHNSPNIRMLTILDFEDVLREEGLQVEKAFFLRRSEQVALWPNFRADSAIYLLK